MFFRCFFFCKQRTAYEMRISDWSSDVCSSDLCMTSRSNVRPPIVPLTEYDARELLSKPLVDLCAEHGPTRVAGSVGCDEKTIRNARDEKSTLRLDFASNPLALDGRALDPILNQDRQSDG